MIIPALETDEDNIDDEWSNLLSNDQNKDQVKEDLKEYNLNKDIELFNKKTKEEAKEEQELISYLFEDNKEQKANCKFINLKLAQNGLN